MAKKMLLVSEDMLNAYKQQQLLTPPTVKKLTALDGEMESILQRNDIDEAQKAKLYQHALSQFIVYHDQAKGERSTGTGHPESSDNDENENETPISSADFEEEILSFVPQNMKRAAASIMQRMKMHPSKISWDDMGRLVIKNKTVPNTNILDLVYDAVNARGKKAPRGSQEFYTALKDINVSETAIKNKKRLQQMKAQVSSPSSRSGTSQTSEGRQTWTPY
jgi:hypothetical protein